jgi:alpha-L-fucosidase
LETVGKWLESNGSAVYGAERGNFSSNVNANYTRKGNTLYIHQQFWPGHTPAAEGLEFFRPEAVLAIGGLRAKAKSARFLKSGQTIQITQDEYALRLTGLPIQAPDQPVVVIEVECDGEPVIDHEAMRGLWPRYKVGVNI